MIIALAICAVLGIGYYILLNQIKTSWCQVAAGSPKASELQGEVVVLLPFRNEGQHLAECIDSIQSSLLSLPLSVQDRVRILLLDDHSEDESSAIAQGADSRYFTYLPIPDGRQGKKAALSYGMEKSNSQWVICTDADVVVHEGWLPAWWAYLSTEEVSMATGPVSVRSDGTYLSRWQRADLMGMMAVTAHGIFRDHYRLANGANMAFERAAWEAVGGWAGNAGWASGDDVFLMQAIYKHSGGKVAMLWDRQAEVVTWPEESWGELWEQRKRWASKTRGYGERGVVWVQGFVWCYSVLAVGMLLFGHGQWKAVGMALVGWKVFWDAVMLRRVAKDFGGGEGVFAYGVLGLMHTLYILLAGIFALIPLRYRWRGRAQQ